LRSVHITVELSRTRKRVWLKAIEGDGKSVVLLNIARDQAITERNNLIERLIKTGEFDQVTADAIPPWGIAPKLFAER